MYTCTKLVIDRLQYSTKGPFSGNDLMQPANGLRPTCGQAGCKECTARFIIDQMSFLLQGKFSLMHQQEDKQREISHFIHLAVCSTGTCGGVELLTTVFVDLLKKRNMYLLF